MKKGAWIDFSLWLAATELVGILSGWLAGDIRAVYQNLHQPPFSPPGWVFPVMWGILYAMMAISAYLIQHADSTPWKKRRTALLLYAAQLAINFSWSIVFFRCGWLEHSLSALAALRRLFEYRHISFESIMAKNRTAFLRFCFSCVIFLRIAVLISQFFMLFPSNL